MTLRAQFDGKALVPVDPVDLQPGHFYEVEVREPSSSARPTSPQEFVQWLESLPAISQEDIEEMQAEIKRGELPIRFESPFDRSDEG